MTRGLAIPLVFVLVLGTGTACATPSGRACFDGAAPAAIPGEPSAPPAPGTVPLRDAAEPLLREVDAHPAVFGGAFLNRSHTVVCVLHVGEAGPARALLAAHAAELPVTWLQVPYSMARLTAVRDAIVGRWQAGALEGVNHVAIDVPMNRVELSLTPEEAAAGERLKQEFGDIVVIRLEERAGLP